MEGCDGWEIRTGKECEGRAALGDETVDAGVSGLELAYGDTGGCSMRKMPEPSLWVPVLPHKIRQCTSHTCGLA